MFCICIFSIKVNLLKATCSIIIARTTPIRIVHNSIIDQNNLAYGIFQSFKFEMSSNDLEWFQIFALEKC